jgi:hypothetical protein
MPLSCCNAAEPLFIRVLSLLQRNRTCYLSRSVSLFLAIAISRFAYSAAGSNSAKSFGVLIKFISSSAVRASQLRCRYGFNLNQKVPAIEF